MNDEQRLGAALRLIAAAGIDLESGDTEVISDAGIGYAYGNGPSSGMSEVWVTGNWNDTDRYDADTKKRVVTSTMPGRLFAALERLKVNGEWSDMNERCSDCNKLVGTQPTWYGWTPQYVITDDGDTVCHDCLKDCAETFVDDYYANNADRAITWLTADELIALGWHDATPDESDAQSGLHPHQTDTPRAVVYCWQSTLSDEDESSDYVFLITDKGQFDVSYRLFVRDDESNES